jgi:hypothetical protein
VVVPDGGSRGPAWLSRAGGTAAPRRDAAGLKEIGHAAATGLAARLAILAPARQREGLIALSVGRNRRPRPYR